MANRQTTTKSLWMLLLTMNVSVLPRCRFSKQRSWRMLHGKWLIMARTRWLCQIFCLPVQMMVSVWQKASLFQFRISQILHLCWLCYIYLICWYWKTLLNATNSSTLESEKKAFVFWWRMGEGVTPKRKTLCSRIIGSAMTSLLCRNLCYGTILSGIKLRAAVQMVCARMKLWWIRVKMKVELTQATMMD